MSKRKVSSTGRKTRSASSVKKVGSKDRPQRFLGISLSGGKTNKTCLAVLEYFPAHNKLFLTRLLEGFEPSENESGDLRLYDAIRELAPELDLVAYNVPLQLPKCLRCELKCPGYEKCNEPEIKWLWKYYRRKVDKKKNTRIFTPYTERCAEYFIATELEEPFYPSHAMGANSAPLLARALFLQRRLKIKAIEVYPKLTLWRLGLGIKIPKSHLRYHKHSIGGEESRLVILRELIDQNIAFIYEQDRRQMVDNNAAFEAFLCALTAFLKSMGQCERPPVDYPKNEAWIDFPKQDLEWHTHKDERMKKVRA